MRVVFELIAEGVGKPGEAPRRHAHREVRSARYGVEKLVRCETHDAAEGAIRRENQIKEWRRDWKISLIEKENPHWLDLYPAPTP